MECTAPPYKGRSHNWDLGAALIDAETGASGRQWPFGASRQSAKSSWHIPTPTSADVYTGNLESSQQSDDSMHSVSLPDFVNRWPTPTASQARAEGMITQMRALVDSGRITKEEAEAMIQGSLTPDRMKPWAAGKVATPPLALAARLWATPTERDSKQEDTFETWEARKNRKKASGSPGGLGQPLLVQVAARMLPTPSSGGESGGPHGIRGGSWPTPKSTTSGPDHARQFREGSGGDDLVTAVNGSLSPDWVSWLMGLPVSWTSLEPLPREEYLDWFQAQLDGTWWQEERGLPRVTTGIPDRVNRLKCLGNGIVPASLALFLTTG
jgi:hypothetical protein